MNIGTNLQFLRRQQKITQEHLAERLGFPGRRFPGGNPAR